MTSPVNVVTIGGGTGQFTLLSGLRDIAEFEITAVVSMMDSGGSTGRLRDEFGVLPPGDALKCILALSPHRDLARRILLRRFSGAGHLRLRGHNAGNMLLTILSRYTGSFPTGIAALAEILEIKGTILPVTIDRATLVAELTDGTRIYGESTIDLPGKNQRANIKEVYLVPHHGDSIAVHAPVLEAIGRADMVIVGPGDLFTSIMPNLVVPGVKEALQKTKAKILYVLNIMTKPGETDAFTATDFIQSIETIIQRKLDNVLVNSQMPDMDLLEKYKLETSDVVFMDPSELGRKGYTINSSDMLNTSGGIIRHDSERLASLVKAVADDIQRVFC